VISADTARQKFRELYGSEPDAVAFAPGRVNLIGEHIDYAGGCVLPFAVTHGVTVAVRAFTGNREFTAHSDLFAGDQPISFGAFAGQGHFETIVARSADEAGVQGAQLSVLSDLPPGRGLSSSAALSVALACAFGATRPKPPFAGGLELARACQRTEIAATGVGCGLMDQYVSVFGQAGCAVLFDTSRYSHEYVKLPPGGLTVLVVDSGQARELSATRYNQRRDELEMAFAAVSRSLGQGRLLADFEEDKLAAAAAALPNPFKRRMQHVLSEQRRVAEFGAAMAAGDTAQMGRLVTECHRSLANDYEVSTPEIDDLVRALARIDGVLGARIMGGGFGGSVLALADGLGVADLAPAIHQHETASGLGAQVLEVTAEDGAQLWSGGRHRLAREYFGDGADA
jgi:galactokinase